MQCMEDNYNIDVLIQKRGKGGKREGIITFLLEYPMLLRALL